MLIPCIFPRWRKWRKHRGNRKQNEPKRGQRWASCGALGGCAGLLLCSVCSCSQPLLGHDNAASHKKNPHRPSPRLPRRRHRQQWRRQTLQRCCPPPMCQPTTAAAHHSTSRRFCRAHASPRPALRSSSPQAARCSHTHQPLHHKHSNRRLLQLCRTSQ